MNSVNLESLPRLGFFLESRFNSSCAVESRSRGTSQVATEIFLISQDFLEFPLFISQHFLFLYFLIHVMFKKSKFQSFSRFETTLFFFYHLRFFPMEKRNGEGGLRDHPGCEERGRGEVQEWRKSCGSTVPRDLEQEEAIISPHARMKTFKIRPRDGEVKSYIQRINCNLIVVKSKDPSSEESSRASQPYILSYESPRPAK